jgi:hypothetical protein
MASFQGIAGKARVCFHENNEAAVEGREIAHHPQHGFPLRIHDLHCANSSVGVRMKWAPAVVSTGQQVWTAAKVLWSLRRSLRARQVRLLAGFVLSGTFVSRRSETLLVTSPSYLEAGKSSLRSSAGRSGMG